VVVIIDTLEPIPSHTKFHLRISDGISHVRTGRQSDLFCIREAVFGIFGMGVVFEDMGAEQQAAIEAWLRGLTGRTGKHAAKDSSSQVRT